MKKPQRSYWQIWNMSVGFLGIQFGWGLQMANMSAIYEYLGAEAASMAVRLPTGVVNCTAPAAQTVKLNLADTSLAGATSLQPLMNQTRFSAESQR